MQTETHLTYKAVWMPEIRHGFDVRTGNDGVTAVAGSCMKSEEVVCVTTWLWNILSEKVVRLMEGNTYCFDNSY